MVKKKHRTVQPSAVAILDGMAHDTMEESKRQER